MGKEHQAHIKDFSPELGRDFNMDREDGREPMKLPYNAYGGVRYIKNYHITKLLPETISDINSKNYAREVHIGKPSEEKENNPKP